MTLTKTTDYMKKNIRVALYVRVSTQEQAKEGYSIGEQTDRLKKFADAHGWTIVKIYTDAGHSGANQERPALQDMIADIEAGRIDKVTVYKLDRLSRSQKDTLELIEDVMLKNGCDFESMTEKFDTATSFGRAMVGILAVFAQLEREQIKERMSLGSEARIKEGKWRGGAHVPFGYDYEPALEKLVVNEYEAMIVRQIFDAFVSGSTLYSIEKEMQEKGQSFRSSTNTNNRTITYVLKNKTYAGYLRNKDQWLKGLHDPIIAEETFDKAQAILEERKRRYDASGYKAGQGAISTNFGGLIYCAHCGGKFCKTISGTKQAGFKYKYICYSRSKRSRKMVKDPNCMNKFYYIDDFDNMIFNEISKLALDPEAINDVKKDKQQTDEAKQIKIIEHQISQISNQLSRFMDLYGIGRYSLEELDAKTAPLMEQRTKLQKEVKRLQSEAKTMTESEVKHLVRSLSDAIEYGTLEERRFIIEQLISRIDVDNETITIHWNFE